MKRQLTSAFVCLPCRRVFKRPSHRLAGARYQLIAYTPSCPHCQAALLKLGEAFRAPAKDDLPAWAKVERDITGGRAFIRDEGFGRLSVRPNRRDTPKGIQSLFQLPARKRRRRPQEAE